jgi:O-succinylhomoserine sulfhydrylase
MQGKTLPPGLHRDTLAVRAGLPPSQWGENSEALYLTSGFVQPDAETSAQRFANPQEGYTYGRTSNPTVTTFEQRLAAMEGTEAAIGTSTGMAAILLLGMGLLKAGDHVVCSRSVFGSTLNLFAKEFGKFGVESTFVSQTDLKEWKAAMRPNTKLLFAETPTNPLTEVCDIPRAGRHRALGRRAAHGGQLLLLAGAAAAGELGADLVMHSGTKYLDGQGRVMAGAMCGPAKIWSRGVRAHRAHRRHDAVAVQRLGGAQGPGDAGHPHAGAVRQCAGGGALPRVAPGGVARVLPRPGIASAACAGDAPAVGAGRRRAVVRRARGRSATLRRNAFKVIDSAQVMSIATNLGDTKTIISHSATTSHGRLTEQQRQAAGIGQGLIRVAVGLEHIDDLKTDLLRGLDKL